MCVCVCEREREREKKKKKNCIFVKELYLALNMGD